MDTPIQFQIQTGSPEPIYRQLMEQLRRRVAAGQWKAGQELPSVRELAGLLAVHPMTISKAYGLLEAEGLLQRRRGLSMVIAAGHERPAPKAERIERLRPTLERAAAEARELAIPKQQVLDLLARLLDDEGKPR
ncbi:GntR family transcriptional regulator [Inhella proteolytica]|uniref:GntR family transcriptional regulator n=1 Tax=Inhella proteolytica TaxID=2795029 RepID=A0A931NE50_9BURK|nr:GntR family transcriptional regulator [Inhella proteolytica]MBH9577307.1 GntR family transcriptional regulator [Inhella proteolytica]